MTGGAERLVVDAALALQQNGFEVVFFTSHHDPQHCFRETADGTLPVRVYGDFLPRSIFGRCAAACAYLRSLWAACCLLVGAAFASGPSGAFDAIIVDSISISIPLLCLFGRHRVRMLDFHLGLECIGALVELKPFILRYSSGCCLTAGLVLLPLSRQTIDQANNAVEEVIPRTS